MRCTHTQNKTKSTYSNAQHGWVVSYIICGCWCLWRSIRQMPRMHPLWEASALLCVCVLVCVRVLAAKVKLMLVSNRGVNVSVSSSSLSSLVSCSPLFFHHHHHFFPFVSRFLPSLLFYPFSIKISPLLSWRSQKQLEIADQMWVRSQLVGHLMKAEAGLWPGQKSSTLDWNVYRGLQYMSNWKWSLLCVQSTLTHWESAALKPKFNIWETYLLSCEKLDKILEITFISVH